MDKEGKLSETEKKKVVAWLDERWKGMDQRCPVCGDPNWSIGDHLVLPITIAPGGIQLGGAGYPQVMLISSKCGYTRYFNAPMIGLKLEEDARPEAAAQETQKQPGGEG